jgi:glycerate dehydrogenase
MKPRIVFLDRGTIGPTVNLTRPRFAHEWIEYASTPPDDVVARLSGATIAVTNKTPIREHMRDRCLRHVEIAAQLVLGNKDDRRPVV